MQFSPADQPDIVRAAQKDDFYKRVFNEQCYDLFSRVFGPRMSMNKQIEVKLLTDACYYGLNTLIGTQTLGEEYCDILQVKYPVRLPTLWERVALIFCHVFAPYIAERFFMRVFSMQPRFVPHLRDLLPKLQRMHLALFYFTGTFYDFSKRLTNIHYIFNGKVDQQRPKYHILGALILVQFGVSLMLSVREKLTKLRNKSLTSIEDYSEAAQPLETQLFNPPKCTLCLEPRKNTTATTCGHLFCWNCIAEWCNNKPECPLCRQNLTLQSLVCIYNY